jgi:RNA polymerase sigma factor (sigma-70 family)
VPKCFIFVNLGNKSLGRRVSYLGGSVSDEEDRARFASVVVPYLADALALARWLTGSRSDAEDVVQDACLRAFRAIGSFAGVNARAWVLTIVRNTAYSWLRKSRNKMLVAIDDLDVEERGQAERGGDVAGLNAITPESELIARVNEARLEAAISALPIEFREALVLRDMQGLEYREIAEVTGMPVGTVMSRLARARHRLIEAIRTDEP